MPRTLVSRQFTQPLCAALALGALSTLGDWIWARWIADGAIVPGVVHGVVFFVALALVLGWAAGSRQVTRRLLWTLPSTGFILAAAFYPLAHAIGYLGALLATWTAMWLALALVLRWAAGGEGSAREAVLRGTAAAIGSGLVFWVVSGMWTQPAPETGYGLRFLYWSAAFLPGMLALLFGQSTVRGSRPEE